MVRTQKLKRKVKESKSKVKLEKSQWKKGKCDVNNEENEDEDDEGSAICPKFGFVYPNKGDVWVCWDSCETWYDLKCTGYAREEDIPDLYYCFKCL